MEEDLLAQISARTGQSLRREDWTARELQVLLESAPTRPLTTLPAKVPALATERQVADPRLRQLHYARQVWKSPARLESLRLKFRKIELVIALEDTLVNLAEESSEVTFSKAINSKFLQSVCERIKKFRTDTGLNLLIAEREGASQFLASVSEIATLYLVSARPFSVVAQVLEALQWKDFFEDFVADSPSEREVLELFPKFESDRLVLVLDDKVETWIENDQPLVIPSLRFLGLQRISSCQLDVTYRLDAHTLFQESLLADQTNRTTVSADCPQLRKLQDRLEKTANFLFAEQYALSARAAFRSLKPLPDSLCICIHDAKRRRTAETLLRLIGVDERQEADGAVVDECPDVLPRKLRSFPLSDVIAAYFNVGEG